MPQSDYVQRLILEVVDKTGSITKIKTDVTGLATETTKAGSAMQSVGAQTAKTQSGFSKLGSSLKNNAGSLTAVTASAWGLFNAFDDLEKKQLSVERLQTRASQAANNLTKAQAKLADIAAKQGKGSAEYAAQLKIVNLAQDKASQSAKKAEIAAGDLNESYIQLGMTAGPMFAALAGSIAQMTSGLGKVGPAAGGASKGMAALNAVSGATTKGLITAGHAAKGFLLALGPIGIALIAIGVLFALYATNAFGFADAVNAAGKAIIDGIGGVVTAVTKAVNQVSSFLGGFLKDIVAGNVPAALERIRDMILGIYTKWIKPTFDQIFQFIMGMLERVASAFSGPIDAITKGVSEAVNTILRILSDLGQGFLDAFAALGGGEILDAISAISDAFTELGKMVLDALTKLFTEDIPALITGLTDMFTAESKKWLDTILKVVDDILKGFMDLGKSIQDEAAKWLDFIMDGIGDLGALGLDLGKLLADGISGGISVWDWNAAWATFMDALRSTAEFFKNIFQEAFNFISTAFWATVNWLKDRAIELGQAIWAAITSFNWAGAWQALVDAFWATVNFIKDNAILIGQKVWDAITHFSWQAAWQSLVDAFWSTVTFIGTNAVQIGQKVWDAITGFSWPAAWKSLQDAFNSTWDAIKIAAGTIASTIAGFLKFAPGVWDALKTAFNTTWNAIKTVAGGIKAAIESSIKFGQNVWDTLKTAFNSTWNAIKTAAGGIKAAIEGAIKFAPTVWDGLLTSFKTAALSIAGATNTLVTKMSDFIKNFSWEDAWKSFTDAITSIGPTVSGAFNELGKALGLIEQDMTKASKGALKLATNEEIMKAKTEELTVKFGQLYVEQGKVIEGWDNNITKTAFATTVTDNLALAIEQMTKVAAEYKVVIDEAGKALEKEMVEGLVKTNAELNAANILWGAGKEKIQGQILALQELNIADMDVTRSLTSLNEAQFHYNEGVIAGKQAMTDMITGLQEQAGELAATNQAWAELTETESEALTAWQQSIAAGIEVTQVLESQKYAVYQYNLGVIEGTQATKDFLDEIVKGKGAYDANRKGLEDVASGLGDVGNMALQSSEQLEQFISVAMGSPGALQGLASEIASLAGEATSFLEFSGKPQELFGEWHFGEDIPAEIQGLFTDADRAMLAGQAQLERTMSFMGPAIGEHFRTGIANMDMSALQEFGPKAANVLRQSGAAIGPVVQELIDSLDALGTTTGPDEMVSAMQRVITAVANANDPTNQLTNNLIEMGNTGELTAKQLDSLVASGMITADMANNVAAGVKSMHGGLAATSEGLSTLISDFDATAKAGENFTIALEDLQQVTVTGLGTFAMLGGEMIKVKDAAGNAVSPLGSAGSAAAGVGIDASEAATKLGALHKILVLLTQITVSPKIDVDASAAHAKLTALHTALVAITKIKVAPVITANTTQAIAAFNAASKAILTLRNNVNSATSNISSAVGKAAAAASSFASKSTSSFNSVGKSALTMRNNVNSATNSMKSALSSAANSVSSSASRIVRSFNSVGSSASSNASRVRSLASAINNLKSKTITVRTNYVSSGIPPRSQISRAQISGVQPAALNLSGDEGAGNFSIGSAIPNMNATVGSNNRPIVIHVTGTINEKVLLKFIHTTSMEDVGAH